MKSEVFNLLAFNSTHSAIRAEKELIASGISVRIIPVPREITANCGISIKVNLGDLKIAREILANNNIEVSGYYYVKKIGLNKEIKAIQ